MLQACLELRFVLGQGVTLERLVIRPVPVAGVADLVTQAKSFESGQD